MKADALTAALLGSSSRRRALLADSATVSIDLEVPLSDIDDKVSDASALAAAICALPLGSIEISSGSAPAAASALCASASSAARLAQVSAAWMRASVLPQRISRQSGATAPALLAPAPRRSPPP